MQDLKQEVKFHKGVGTYIQMFSPEQKELPIGSLVPMPQNQEINGPLLFDDHHKRMVESFKLVGQNRPAIVFPKDNDQYWIIDGVRNKYAGEEAGFTHLSCLVLKVDEGRAFEIMQVLNSGQRRITYQMKAKKLELLDKHAKQYLREAGADDNEASDQTVRQYKAVILQMCERYVSEFQAICAHPDKDNLLDQMDKKLITMNKASALARNKQVTIPPVKGKLPLGKKPVLTCPECPRKKEFLDMIEDYGDDQDLREEGEAQEELGNEEGEVCYA